MRQKLGGAKREGRPIRRKISGQRAMILLKHGLVNLTNRWKVWGPKIVKLRSAELKGFAKDLRRIATEMDRA